MLGAGSYERTESRRGYRHGSQERTLRRAPAKTTFNMPGRNSCRQRRASEWESTMIPVMFDVQSVDFAILGMYFGGQHRKVKQALRRCCVTRLYQVSRLSSDREAEGILESCANAAWPIRYPISLPRWHLRTRPLWSKTSSLPSWPPLDQWQGKKILLLWRRAGEARSLEELAGIIE